MDQIMSMLGNSGMDMGNIDPSMIMNFLTGGANSGNQQSMANMFEKLKDMEVGEDGSINTDKLVKELLSENPNHDNPLLNTIIQEGVGFFHENEEILEEFAEEEVFSKTDDFEANLKERKEMWEIESEKERTTRIAQDVCDQLSQFINYVAEQVSEDNYNKKVYSMVYELTLTFRKSDPLKVVEIVKNALDPHMHALEKKTKSNVSYALDNIDKIDLFKSVGVKKDIAPLSQKVHYRLYDYLFEIARLLEVFDKKVDEETYMRALRVRKLKEIEKKSNTHKQSEDLFKPDQEGKDQPLATAFVSKVRSFYVELSQMVEHTPSKRDISKIPLVIDAMKDNFGVYKLVKSAYEKHDLGKIFSGSSISAVRENMQHIPFLGKIEPVAFEQLADDQITQLQKELGMITHLLSFIQNVPAETLSVLTDITRDLNNTTISQSKDLNQDVMKVALHKIFKDPKANSGMKQMIKSTMKKLNEKPADNYRSKMFEEFEQNAQSVLEDL